MTRIQNGVIIQDEETGISDDTPLRTSRFPSWLQSLLPSKLRTSPVSLWLITIQVLMYILSCLVVPPRGFYYPTGLALLRIGSGSTEFTACTVCGYVWEIRRLLTAIFLHLNLIHILFNILFQISAGPNFEESMGKRSFLILFLGSGVLGNLLATAFHESGVGSSSACYGLLGAGYMLEYILWPTMDLSTRESTKHRLIVQTALLLLWELLNWNSLGHFAHLGGLIGGMLLLPLHRTAMGTREEKIRHMSKFALLILLIGTSSLIWIPVFTNYTSERTYCAGLMSIYY
jgi:rhomboid protease GluP